MAPLWGVSDSIKTSLNFGGVGLSALCVPKGHLPKRSWSGDPPGFPLSPSTPPFWGDCQLLCWPCTSPAFTDPLSSLPCLKNRVSQGFVCMFPTASTLSQLLETVLAAGQARRDGTRGGEASISTPRPVSPPLALILEQIPQLGARSALTPKRAPRAGGSCEFCEGCLRGCSQQSPPGKGWGMDAAGAGSPCTEEVIPCREGAPW